MDHQAIASMGMGVGVVETGNARDRIPIVSTCSTTSVLPPSHSKYHFTHCPMYLSSVSSTICLNFNSKISFFSACVCVYVFPSYSKNKCVAAFVLSIPRIKRVFLLGERLHLPDQRKETIAFYLEELKQAGISELNTLDASSQVSKSHGNEGKMQKYFKTIYKINNKTKIKNKHVQTSY